MPAPWRGGRPARPVGIAAGPRSRAPVGAGTVLGGNYYREGDKLHFEAQLVDARTGRLILALQPAIGPLREQTRVIELLRQRVMARVRRGLSAGFSDWHSAGVPPTYAAYQEMLIASDDVWTFKAFEAIPHLRPAIAEIPPTPGQGPAGLCPERHRRLRRGGLHRRSP